MGGTNRGHERAQSRAPEAELIREAQAGSRVAFDALVRQYESQVLRLAMHLTGSEHDAEDIYQEAFLKAFRYIGNFRFECSFCIRGSTASSPIFALTSCAGERPGARRPCGNRGPVRR